jgi:hypothetical protein
MSCDGWGALNPNYNHNPNPTQAGGGFSSQTFSFKTLSDAAGSPESPLRIGFVADMGYGAHFSVEIYTRGCHCIPRLLASSEQTCDQWHSSRKFSFLTSSHCELRPTTEGTQPNLTTQSGL